VNSIKITALLLVRSTDSKISIVPTVGHISGMEDWEQNNTCYYRVLWHGVL